jgi:hypothetical protein
VGWFTADNASNNNTALRELKNYIDQDGDCWDPVECQVQYAMILFASSPTHLYYSCMEHSLHLGVGHILSCIIPVCTKKTHGAEKDSDDDESDRGFTSDDSSTITPHALYKLLELIKQVYLIHHIYYIH